MKASVENARLISQVLEIKIGAEMYYYLLDDFKDFCEDPMAHLDYVELIREINKIFRAWSMGLVSYEEIPIHIDKVIFDYIMEY